MLMVARKGIQQFSLPAGGKRRAKQALSGLQIVGRWIRAAIQLRWPSARAVLKPDGIPLQMQLQRLRIVSADRAARACSHCRYSGLRLPRRPGSSVTRAPASSERRYRHQQSLSASHSGVSSTSSAGALKKRHPAGNGWQHEYGGCWLQAAWHCSSTITRSAGSRRWWGESQSPRCTASFAHRRQYSAQCCPACACSTA